MAVKRPRGSGQLGIGTLAQDSVPRLVTGGLAFSQISAGETHTCGITTSDEIYCWGNNGNGRLGNGGSGGTFTEPQLVPTPTGVVFESVSAGGGSFLGGFTCATTTSASTGSPAGAYCWGYNLYGQLGDASTVEKNVPTLVAPPAGVRWLPARGR